MKKCVLCGKLFQPAKNAQRICTEQHYRKCKACGKLFPISRPSDSQQCCSKECTQSIRSATMVQRYGVPHALQSQEFVEKAEATQLKKYGVKHAAQSEQVKQKTREMFIEKYGVPTPFQMDDFQEKSTKTCLEKYGVSFTSQIPGRTEKMQATNLDRYGATYPLGSQELASKVREQMQAKYGVPYYCMTNECRSKQKQTISSFNRAMMQKLSDAGIESTPEDICIDRYSYDIHLTGTNILIEVNPTDTHNAICNPWANVGLDINYHKHKSQLASDNGYRCIHIWDWDDSEKIVSMLKPKTAVYARQCKIKPISADDAKTFERLYHLQNDVRGQKICYGLYYNDELVQIMTFGTPRYNANYQYELLRLCSNNKYAVVGGAEKLWKHFLKFHHPVSVISYCDRSKFTGGVYSRLNMQLHHITDPNKVWSKNTQMITNNLLNQRGYDQLFHTSYGKGTSNEQLMIDNGWLPVYDCGQAVYVYEVS